ncbi:RICIN domain-containing protein [Dubosiella newyorkensis]|uniref:RICIN domain-containing protein n=1 Tax=Dubosiella newyorkensis TaxID=1862672 RepID=UPI0023F52035|nr:RICIN domain-containing protein [Dubosiella newyorkensis]
MIKKDYSLLVAAFIGLSSGWAVMNQEALASQSEEVLVVGEEQPASESPNEDSKSTVQTDIAHEDPDPDIEPTDEDQTLEQTENEEGTSGTIFQKEGESSPIGSSTIEEKKDADEEAPILETKPQQTVDVIETKEEVQIAPIKKVVAAPMKTTGQTGWNNNKYYENGQLAIGEKKIGNTTHLFDNDGNPLVGFIQYDGKLVFCDAKGAIQTGSFTSADGRGKFTADSTGKIISSNLENIPYYNQNDGQWAMIHVGGLTLSSSGCVAMTATSVINHFNQTHYSPVDIAREMNKKGYLNAPGGYGTTSDVWEYIAKTYGLTYKNNLGYNSIIDSLLEGNIVAGAVGFSRWCPYYGGVTHEIYLSGYRNGQVYVHDPLHDNQQGWYSLSSVWDVRSKDSGDNLNGGPFYALGKIVKKIINSSLSSQGTIVIGDQRYTGKPITTKPIVGISQNGNYIQLQEGKDYTLSFENNTKPGQATVSVMGKGLYKGTLKKAFYIVDSTITNSRYTIHSKGNGNLVIDVPAGSKNKCVSLQIYQSNDTNAQQYYIEKQKNGYYTIKNRNSGLYLTTSSDWRNVHNGLKVTQQSLRNDLSSYWMIRSTANGHVFSTAIDSAYVLDIPAADFRNGNTLQIYTYNGSKAQLWSLDDLDAVIRNADALAQKSKGTISDGYYVIGSKINGNKVLDVTGASTNNGANVQIYTNNGTDAQLYRISYEGDYLKIMNVGSGKVLDVNGGSTKNGTNVQQFAWNGTRAQKWIAVKLEDGIKLVSALNTNLVLDLAGAQTKDGTNIAIYASNNTKAQRWTFIKKEDPRTAMNKMAQQGKKLVNVGTYEIHSMVDGSYNLDVTAANKNNGANIQLYADNNTGAQRWKISYDGNGYALIQNINSGKYLGTAGNQAKSGLNVIQSNLNGYATKWFFKNLNGSIQIVSALHKDYVLDLSGAHAVNGRNIQLYSNNGTNAQKWKFVKV